MLVVTNQEEKWEKLKILDFLSPNAIVMELTATTKKGVLEELVGALRPKKARSKTPK